MFTVNCFGLQRLYDNATTTSEFVISPSLLVPKKVLLGGTTAENHSKEALIRLLEIIVKKNFAQVFQSQFCTISTCVTRHELLKFTFMDKLKTFNEDGSPGAYRVMQQDLLCANSTKSRRNELTIGTKVAFFVPHLVQGGDNWSSKSSEGGFQCVTDK